MDNRGGGLNSVRGSKKKTFPAPPPVYSVLESNLDICWFYIILELAGPSNPARIQVQIMKSNGTGIELEVEGHDISCTCALIPEETIIFHLPNFCEKSNFVNNTLCTTAAVGRAVDIYEVEIIDQHKSYTEID